MATKYSTYLFVDPVNRANGLSTGLGFSSGVPRPVLLRDLEDAMEMMARRYFLGHVLPGMSSSDFSRYKVASSVKWRLNRRLDNKTYYDDADRVREDLGGRRFAASMADAVDERGSYDVSGLPGPWTSWYGTRIVRGEALSSGLDTMFDDQRNCCFLDPAWELPEGWGADASGTFRYEVVGTHDGVVEGPRSGTLSRMVPPDGTLFSSVMDAVYARALRSGTYRWVDGSGEVRTARVSVPPYSTWYDPAGNGYKTTLDGRTVRRWRYYEEGAGPLHESGMLTFPYSPSESSDFGQDDPPYSIASVSSRLAYIGPGHVAETAVFNGSRLIPPLRTGGSWWEDNRLGVGNGGAALADLPQGAVLSAVESMYSAPAVTPGLKCMGGAFPPEDGYAYSDEGRSYYGFWVRTLHRATLSHARKVLDLLHRVVMKVPCVRVEFDAVHKERTDEYKTAYGFDDADDYPKSSWRIEGPNWAKGWMESDVQGGYGTYIDGSTGGSFNGLNFRQKGRSADETCRFVERSTWSWTRLASRETGLTTDVTMTFSDRYVLDKIIPVRTQGAYSYRHQSNSSHSNERGDPYEYVGEVYTSQNNPDKKPDLMIPDELLPFVKSAELIAVVDLTMETWPRQTGTIVQNELFETSMASSYYDTLYSGRFLLQGTSRRIRKVVSLGKSNILQFGPLDAHQFMDDLVSPPLGCGRVMSDYSILPFSHVSDHAGGSFDLHLSNDRGLGYGVYRCYDRSETIDTVPCLERTINGIELYLVVDFDPDVDGVDMWASGIPEVTALKDAYAALLEAQRALAAAEAGLVGAEAAESSAASALSDAEDALSALQAAGESGWSADISSRLQALDLEIADAQQGVDDAQTAYDSAQASVATRAADVSAAQTALDNVPEGEDASAEVAALAAAQAALDAALSDASSAYETLYSRSEALADLEARKRKLEQERTDGYAKALTDAQALVDARQAELDAASGAVATAQAAVTAAQQTVASRQSAYSSAREAAAQYIGSWDPAGG